MHNHRIAVFALALALASQTALAQSTSVPSQPSAAMQQDRSIPATAGQDAGYRLGAADRVRIIIYNEPTLSGDFVVSEAGTLSLPLIGDVQARGRTALEVSREIERKLGDGYLRNPQVSMDVTSFRPFYILGEVTKPGEYPYSAGLTVMNAVARAEGYTYRANKRKVFIKRAGSTTEEQVKVTPDLQVYPGDTIRIGERYF